MGEVIELPLDGGRRALILEETEGVAWFECAFDDRDRGQRLPLGAEQRAYLLSHLRTVLDESVDSQGLIDGTPVRWILSLAERHVALYASLSTGPNETRTLFLQDARGEVLRTAELHREDADVWRSRLQAP